MHLLVWLGPASASLSLVASCQHPDTVRIEAPGVERVHREDGKQ